MNKSQHLENLEVFKKILKRLQEDNEIPLFTKEELEQFEKAIDLEFEEFLKT